VIARFLWIDRSDKFPPADLGEIKLFVGKFDGTDIYRQRINTVSANDSHRTSREYRILRVAKIFGLSKAYNIGLDRENSLVPNDTFQSEVWFLILGG
jgi:hypothetical protein